MDRLAALNVVRSFPGDSLVSELYDHDSTFADALNDLFPGTFEYPDIAHLKVSEVLEIAEIDRERGARICHFEYIDPFADAKYSFDTIEKAMSHCNAIGLYRFQAIRQDGEIVQVNKIDGVWEREDDPLVIRRKAAEEALVLASELESRIRAELREDMHDVSRMPSEVRMAYREMGVDPREDAERCALQGIEARSMAYADAATTAKAAKIEGPLDLNARLRAMRNMTVIVLSPEVSRMWAELDIRDFLKIQMSPHRKEDAGLLLATNMAANAEYKTALIEKNPSIAAMATAFDAENDRLIAAKEERKAAEMKNMQEQETGWPEWEEMVLDGTNLMITKNPNNKMFGLTNSGESTVIEFGGIPAIQNYAKENSSVPTRVINRLLALEGGYLGAVISPSDVALEHPDKSRVVVRETPDEAWAAAAKSAVRHFELSDLKMRCEMLAGDNKVSIEDPWCGDGEWSGPVALVSNHFLLVSLGDNKYVAHEKAKLDGAVMEVSGDVPVGAFMHVIQKSGRFVFQQIERNNKPEYEEAECVPVCRP